ncbi:MAG TPA: hypothetical protein ENK18_23400 [Deltaproteobacteria bacterium]|nr:hypothetical protein [Deltaproteobacteria bacterium]
MRWLTGLALTLSLSACEALDTLERVAPGSQVANLYLHLHLDQGEERPRIEVTLGETTLSDTEPSGGICRPGRGSYGSFDLSWGGIVAEPAGEVEVLLDGDPVPLEPDQRGLIKQESLADLYGELLFWPTGDTLSFSVEGSGMVPIPTEPYVSNGFPSLEGEDLFTIPGAPRTVTAELQPSGELQVTWSGADAPGSWVDLVLEGALTSSSGGPFPPQITCRVLDTGSYTVSAADIDALETDLVSLLLLRSTGVVYEDTSSGVLVIAGATHSSAHPVLLAP